MKVYIHARLGEQDRAALDEIKQSTGRTESELVRQGLRLVAEEQGRRRSALDLAGSSVGTFKTGPKDLSTNRKHLDGFGIMNEPIDAKRLRASLPDVVERVRKGTRFTVMYRSRPAFQIVPVNEPGHSPAALEDDPLYRAPAVGRSRDGRTAADHDAVLYGR